MLKFEESLKFLIPKFLTYLKIVRLRPFEKLSSGDYQDCGRFDAHKKEL
jgi:hypothetical protein